MKVRKWRAERFRGELFFGRWVGFSFQGITSRLLWLGRISQSVPANFLEADFWPGIVSLLMFQSCMKLVRLLDQNNRSLDLLTEVGTQGERAVIVQLLVTSPPHGIAHSLYLDLSSKFQSVPFGDLRKHELCLPNLAR
jgi:hypothetical protein